MTISWLHLSDLHLRDQDHRYEAKMVLKTLLKDIEEYATTEGIDLDFAFLTGDVAYAGKSTDYEFACWFIDELCRITSLPKSRIFVVPGNHDIDRTDVTPGAKFIGGALQSSEDILKLFNTKDDRKLVFRGLGKYALFVKDCFKGHLHFDDEHFFFVKKFDIDDNQVAILGLNSAWSCLSDKRHRDSLLVGKAQVIKALDQSGDADIRIALVHHPFDWLQDFDRKYVERTLRRTCAFVLHGHLHEEQVKIEFTLEGRTAMIPAGACYVGSEYANSYNFVVFNPSSERGTVHLRRYSVRLQRWVKDIDATGDKRDGRVEIDLSERQASSIPFLTLQQYKEIVASFRLPEHFNENIEVDRAKVKAEAYYMARLEEFERSVLKSLELYDIPLLHLFEQFEEIVYVGALKTFKPLLDFINGHKPVNAKSLTEMEVDKVSLAFTRLVLDKYLKESHGLHNFVESLTIESNAKKVE